MLSMEGVVIGNVAFEPGCRNFWHVHHEGGQILLVTGGRGWYQEWNQPARELETGDVVHIPAGIGVLEAVFIALLAGEHTSKGTIIAALLAYRVLYYFIPLLLALICYLLLESQAKKLRAKNEAAM